MIGIIGVAIIKANPFNEINYKTLDPLSDFIENPEQQTLPAIYYSAKATEDKLKNGVGGCNWVLTLETYCNRYSEAWELAAALIKAFQSYDRKEIKGFNVYKISLTKLEDNYETPLKTYGQIIEFEIQTANLLN